MGSGMMRTSRRAAIALAAIVTCSASAAHAIEERTCLPFNDMVAALRAEGQHTIVQGDKVGLDKGPRALVIYTGNDSGSRGYEVGGHRKVEGQMPPELCIRATLANVRFHNALERTIPASWRLPRSLTPEEVRAEAERRGLAMTADYNRSLDQGAGHGGYPVLKANFVIGGKATGAFLDVRMAPADKTGASASVSPTGFSWQTDVLANMGYGQFALEQFKNLARQGSPVPQQ